MSSPTVEQLRGIDLFAGLDDAELEAWAAAAQLKQLQAGVVVAEQGELTASVHLVLEGSLEAFAIDSAGRSEPVGLHVAPTWVGATAALTGGFSGVRMQSATDVTLAAIGAEPFVELAIAQRPVFSRVMAQIRPVVSRINAVEQNRERLASLGTMAAGLAHELNNPASAAQRAAADLADALEVLSSTIGTFVESGIERAQAQALVGLQREALASRAASSALDTLDAADAEDELLDALEALGVEDAWRLTEPLASARVDGAWLARVHELAGDATGPALQWVAASLSAHNLARELGESTRRMSDLVTAVKSYAYMDRGELQAVDIHEGLETTLTMLGHKLRHTEIEVKRNYDRTLPAVTVHGGELNQVWTNLLDNAIHSLGQRGEIEIVTALEGSCVRVDIRDSGPGIPAEVVQRIFDPFFTTKQPGEGTGLGLDAARRIVVDRHGGSIGVDSAPGETVFHVRLPIRQPERDATSSHNGQGDTR
jgi:signal transduction histidine kinase